VPSSEQVAFERTARRRNLGFAAFGIFAAALVTIGIMVASDPTKTPFVIGAGILGSLIASFLMLAVTEILLGPSRDDQAATAARLDASLGALDGALGALDSAVGTLDAAIPLMAQATQHGFVAVKPKSHYSSDDWSAVLRDANEKLLLVGHALDKWCAEDIRPLFEETLERLALAGKTVQLLTLPIAGANTTRITDQRGKDYSRRVQTTHDVVAAVYHRLPSEFRSALSVRALSSDVDMPYIVANEHVVITCAYPTTAQSSDSMLTTTAHPDKPFGRAVREDLRQLIDRHTDAVPFPRREP
jgi:hypothetical protein